MKETKMENNLTWKTYWGINMEIPDGRIPPVLAPIKEISEKWNKDVNLKFICLGSPQNTDSHAYHLIADGSQYHSDVIGHLEKLFDWKERDGYLTNDEFELKDREFDETHKTREEQVRSFISSINYTALKERA